MQFLFENRDEGTCVYILHLFLTGGHNLLEEHKIPASYLAVKDAVNNVTVECYSTNQTPVLKADVFRY